MFSTPFDAVLFVILFIGLALLAECMAGSDDDFDDMGWA